MSDIPIISITQDDNLNDIDEDEDDEMNEKCNSMNISDCHTDTEDLEGDEKDDNLINFSKNRKRSCQPRASLTDYEDYNVSGTDDEENGEKMIENEMDIPITLDEFLDQGLIEESSKVTGQKKKQSTTHTTNPSQSLSVHFDDAGGITDCEENVISDEDEVDEEEDTRYQNNEAIILEESNSIDIQDAIRRKTENTVMAPTKPAKVESSSSGSEDENIQRIHHFHRKGYKREDAKSDVENIVFSDDEILKTRKVCRKYKRAEYVDDAEEMMLQGSDTDAITPSEAKKFPEINITFVQNDIDKYTNNTSIKAAKLLSLSVPDNQDEALTDCENLESSTDDEDDNNNIKTNKFLIPRAIIKSENDLTDVEDFDSENDMEDDEKEFKIGDFPLPSPVREMKVFREDESGKPITQVWPLGDNIHLGLDNTTYTDMGLTDVEDFSGDENDLVDETQKFLIDKMPEMEMGSVYSCDSATNKKRFKNHSDDENFDPLTDTEDIFVSNVNNTEQKRARRTRTRHSHGNSSSHHGGESSKYLFAANAKPHHHGNCNMKLNVDSNAGGALTDVEDLDVEDDDIILSDKSLKQRRATIGVTHISHQNQQIDDDNKTDCELLSGDESSYLSRYSPDINISGNVLNQQDCATITSSSELLGSNLSHEKSYFNIPIIRKIPPTPDLYNNNNQTNTDIEMMSDNDENLIIEASISRAQTATPSEVHEAMYECGQSEVHDTNSGLFNCSLNETKPMRQFGDVYTDVEYLEEDNAAQ